VGQRHRPARDRPDPAATHQDQESDGHPGRHRKSQTDIQGVIASLTSCKYDNSWWYFSTRNQINLKLNDELHETVNDHTRYKIAHYKYSRLLDACLVGQRPWPRPAEKERFFAEYGLGPRYC
jgi:hypothetical protein